MQGSGYDPIKSSRERRERFGIGPLKPQTPQVTKIPKMPAMIRKTSAIDPEAEELTPEGEKAFLEGLASAGDSVPQWKTGDALRRSFDNMLGNGLGKRDAPQARDVIASANRGNVADKVIPYAGTLQNLDAAEFGAELEMHRILQDLGERLGTASEKIIERMNALRSIFGPEIMYPKTLKPEEFLLDALDFGLRWQHYSRNKYNTPLPQTTQEAEDWGWKIEDEDYCHQFGVPNIGNVKYIPSEGGREQIFTPDGKVDNSAENRASYNFFHPQENPVLHGIVDVLPWFLYGNAPDDTTTRLERIVKPLVYSYYEKNIRNRNSDSSDIPDR